MRVDRYSLPSFDADSSRVKGYSAVGYEVVARVFLPLDDRGTAVRWSVFAESLGIVLTATTRWSELASSVDPETGPSITYGFVEAKTVTRLVETLWGETATPEEVFFAIWPGYTEGIPPVAWRTTLASTRDCYLTAESYELVRDSLVWLSQCSEANDLHFPAAFWPADQAFVAATWPYHDSLYLSCSAKTLLNLQRAGFDAFPIDREVLLPSEGD